MKDQYKIKAQAIIKMNIYIKKYTYKYIKI